ncbi:MAG: SurA N-terminal domain-containing protein [Halanaerobiales bacterium]
MISELRNYSKFIIIIIAVAMVVTGALYGYGRFTGSPESNPQSAYVARVNGTNITQQEYYNVLRNQSAGRSDITRSQEVPFKLNVLNSMIDRELLLQKAEEMDLKSNVSDENVNEYIDETLENNNMSMDELENFLEGQNSNLNKFKQDIKNGLRAENLIKQVRERSYSDITVTEEEIVNFYEKIHPQVIAINFDDDKQTASSEIEEALNRIESGSSFGDVASEYSDLAAGSKGDLGTLGHDNKYFSGDVTNRIFELEKGKTSDVIEGDKAFYVVKVLDKKTATGEEFEEAKEEVRKDLLEEKQQQAFDNWLQSVKSESNIIIEDPLLAGYKAKEEGNINTAITELEEALESYPATMTYIYLAQAYQENDQQDKAIETFEAALEEFPEDWEVHYNYAMALADQEETDKEKAVDLLDNAAEFAGEELMAHYQIYIGYNQLGAEEKAEAEMEKVVEIQEKLQEQQKETQPNGEEIETENETGNENIEVPEENNLDNDDDE